MFYPIKPVRLEKPSIFHILDSHMSANSNILHRPEIQNITFNKFPSISLKHSNFHNFTILPPSTPNNLAKKFLQTNSKPTQLQTHTSSSSFSLHFFVDHYNLLTYLMLKIKEEYWNSRGRKEVTNKNKK